MLRPLLGLLALTAFAAPASAVVVCVQNRTADEIEFVVTHADGKRTLVKLGSGDTQAIPVGREPTLIVTRKSKNETYKLDPYTPYLFVPADGGGFEFQGVKLLGELPKPDDVAVSPVDRKPIRVPVSLLTDDRDQRVRAVWEKAYRARFEAAAPVFEKHLGVKLEIDGTAEWKTPTDNGWDHAFEHFQTAREVKAGGLAVGFLAKALPKDDPEQWGAVGRPWKTHILLRDGWPRGEAERVDVLTQYLGLHFGAVRTTDPASVMRVRLLDGQSAKAGYVPRFDPLNLLAMHVWADEKAAGNGTTWETLRPKARERLLVLYKTLAELPTKDPLATEYVEALAAARDNLPIPAKPVAPPLDTERKLTDREKAVWGVVRAVTNTATGLAESPKRPRGDALTAEYVRAAAVAAGEQAEAHRSAAFLIGLGLALDDSTILRSNPLTRRLVEKVESDEERKVRLASLGVPTVRGRRDLCQHFVVSVALVQLGNAEAAELAGLAKELSDMKGASGFSFVDLLADYAGVAFAQAVTADSTLLPKLAARFTVEDWMPAFDGLREGLPEDKFKADFGGTDDKRFAAVVADLRKRVADLPAHKK